MRISDWSSDVCSTDLRMSLDNGTGRNITARLAQIFHITRTGARRRFGSKDTRARHEAADHRGKAAIIFEIGRAQSELQSLMRISYAVFCLKKKKKTTKHKSTILQSIHRKKEHAI